MHQIDNPWVATTKPPVQPVGTPGWFQPGDESTQLLATVVDYDWANTIQAELINVVTNAGLTPSKTDDAQLVNSIIAIVIREAGLVTGGPYLPLAGGVMGGTIYSNASAGITRALTSQTAGKNRWIAALADNSAENGGNTGSDFTLTRCDDNGNAIDVVMRCHRYTGVVDFPMGMTFGSGVIGGVGGGSGNLPTDPPTLTLNQNTTVSVNTFNGTYRSLAACWAAIRTWDLNGFNLTIVYTAWDQFGGTEYPGGGVVFDCRMYGQTSASQLTLTGDSTIPVPHTIAASSPPGYANAAGGACIGVKGGAMLTVGSLLRLQSTTTAPSQPGPAVGLWAYGAPSQIVMIQDNAKALSFGNCAYAHVLADGGSITIGTTPGGTTQYTFDTYEGYAAGSQSHWHARNAGVIDLSAGMLNIQGSGTPTGVVFSGAFTIAETGAQVLAPDTGSSLPWGVKTGITGSRYKVDATSQITNTGGNINYLPGNAVGTVAPGGIYS